MFLLSILALFPELNSVSSSLGLSGTEEQVASRPCRRELGKWCPGLRPIPGTWSIYMLHEFKERMARIRICFIVTSQLAFVIFLLSLTGFSIHYHNRSICFQVERIFQYHPKHPGMVRWNKWASCSQGTHKLFFQSKYPENILKLKKNPNKPW